MSEIIQKMFHNVGILTFTYGENYGQRLQNLAMQEYLKRYFDNVYTIRQIENKVGIVRQTKMIFKRILTGTYSAQKRRKENFRNFNHKYLIFYDCPININDIGKFPEKEFEYFVCGSDQIWSPYSNDVNSTYFLTFTSPSKKIALSPSLSADSIPEEKKDEFKRYLTNFKFISTREYVGSNLVSELTGNKVETLIDPTLMFDADFWVKYENKPKSGNDDKYALCYFLGEPEQMSRIHNECNKKGLKVVDILNDRNVISCGPSEFIYLIHNATKIYTDSYHGTIFSIIFNKPFVLCKRKGSSVDMSSRFDTLFSKLGISLDGDNDMEEYNNIDPKYLKDRIDSERSKFENFFLKCVNNNASS
ncbi:MAG: polysaccharide pyruvyl transferase family protein [Subdoligranulum sp.]